MLPARFLTYSDRARQLVPHYLAANDEPWVREIMSELDSLVGKTALEIDEAFSGRISEAARAAKVPSRTLCGLWHVCLRIWTLKSVAVARPSRVRSVVFDMAATSPDREGALEAAAGKLGLTREQVLASLFADRPAARRLQAPASAPSPVEVVRLYNLALLQGLLLHSSEVVVHARTHVRSVVRFARLKRLLCTYDSDAEGLRLTLSGPLSVLRYTTKYGHALASFVPSAIATPGWSLEARCHLGPKGEARLVAGSGDPIGSTHALPREADSAVERHLLRDFRRLGSPWTIARETAALRVGQRIFFPDFSLTRGADRILVEIVGYYTPEYLESKLRVLREARLERMIVCIDEALACGEEPVVAGAVVRYRRRVDAGVLLRAVDSVAASDFSPHTARPDMSAGSHR